MRQTVQLAIATFLLIAAAPVGSMLTSAMAQIPGTIPDSRSPFPRVPTSPYPMPPGGPGTTRRAPLPGGTPIPGRIPGPRAPQPQGGSRPVRVQRPALVTEGVLRELTERQLTIEAADHRIIWYRLADNVAVFKDREPFDLTEAEIGDRVRVRSTENELGEYTATSVDWLAEAIVEERTRVRENWDLPGDRIPAGEVDERPVLRRRGAAEVAGETSAETGADATGETAGPVANPTDAATGTPATIASPERPLPIGVNADGSVLGDDAVIAEARRAAARFLESLPSFAAKQQTTRYLSEGFMLAGGGTQWTALDVVTAELVYRDGAESYRNIEVGGDGAGESMEALEGMRSTGEFGTLQAEILAPQSGASFSRMGQDRIAGRAAWKYQYRIPRERSLWRVETPSQLYYPAYGGTLWIDQDTARVVRLEQEALDLPPQFPFDVTEVTVDYGFVRLEGTTQFLLPTDAEALYCVRGTRVCRRNHTEFRNYVKFEAESEIGFPELE